MLVSGSCLYFFWQFQFSNAQTSREKMLLFSTNPNRYHRHSTGPPDLLKSTPPHVDAITKTLNLWCIYRTIWSSYMVNVGKYTYTYQPHFESLGEKKNTSNHHLQPSNLIPESHPPLVQPQALSIVDQGRPETGRAWRGWSEVATPPKLVNIWGKGVNCFVLRMNV